MSPSILLDFPRMADETTPGIEASTAIHETVASPESPLAYSQTVELPELQRSHVPVVAFAAAFLALVAACAGWFLLRPTPTANPPTPRPAAPVRGPIDGTYRVDRYRGEGVTTMPSGKVSEPAAAYSTAETEWWAFQSACSPMGCSAVGSRLDNGAHTKIVAQLVQNLPENEKTQSLRLINGHWISDPPNHVPQDCPAGMPGHDMWRFTMELTQVPDGTLRGQESDLVESNECGGAGMVATTPVVATRVGDLPPGLPPLNTK